jgi:hypothetical protein
MTTLRYANKLNRAAQDLQVKRANRIRGIVVRPPLISREDYEAQHGPLDLDAYRQRVAECLNGLGERAEIGGLTVRFPICAELREIERQVEAEYGVATNAAGLI